MCTQRSKRKSCFRQLRAYNMCDFIHTRIGESSVMPHRWWLIVKSIYFAFFFLFFLVSEPESQITVDEYECRFLLSSVYTIRNRAVLLRNRTWWIRWVSLYLYIYTYNIHNYYATFLSFLFFFFFFSFVHSSNSPTSKFKLQWICKVEQTPMHNIIIINTDLSKCKWKWQ